MKILNLIKDNKYPLVLFLLTLFFFNKLFLNPQKMLLPGDILGSAYFPKFFFSAFTTNNLQIPLWNPFMFSGMPFQADPSSSMFYPLNLLFLIFPVGYVFGYLFFIDIFLIGLFTYFYCREVGLEKFSSLVSSTIFMFSGPIVFRIYAGHLYILDAIVWLPLLLFFIEKLLKTNKIIFAVYGAIPIALMIFAGHSQFTFYNLVFSSGYFFIRLLFIFKDKKNIYLFLKPTFLFLLSVIIGLCLSSIQLLPSLELSNLSERSNGISFEFAKAFSLHPYQLISFIFPYFFGSPFNNSFWGKGNFWETTGYIGILPILFSFAAIFFNKNRYVFIFSLLTIIALVLSFGGYTPIYDKFFNYIPFFNLFRAPARFLYIYAFSAAILSGFGISFILNHKFAKEELKKYKFISTAVIVFLILLITLIISLPSANYLYLYEKFILKNSFAVGINHSVLFNLIYLDIIHFLLLSLSFSIVFLLFIAKEIKSSIFKFLIVLILFLDLWVFSLGTISLSGVNEQYKMPKVISEITKDKTLFRIFSQTGEYSNISMIKGLQILNGYNGEYLKNYRDFLWITGAHENTPFESFIIINSIDNSTILSLLNTKYIIWNTKINVENFKFINEYDENNIKSYLYENLSFFPRAYVISNSSVKSGKFIVSKKAKLIPENDSKNKPNFLKLNKSDISDIARITNYSNNQITINVIMNESGYLVLSEVWYPGWKAYDNGVQKEILKGDYIFRTIYLEKGIHNIKFIFDPKIYKVGEFVSLTTLFTLIIFFVFSLKPKFFYKHKPKRLRLP